MEKGGQYKCMINMAWVDWRFTTAPGVPVLKNLVQDYTEQFCPPHAPEQINLTIAVPHASMDIAAERGSLKAVTPQEEVIAPLWAMGKHLANKELTGAAIENWKKRFLTVSATFKLLKTDEDREFETIKIRQEAHHRFAAIVYTPVQWVCKIAQMKRDRPGASSAADIAKLFKNRGFKPAKGQDDISGTFVINSLYIWDHALCHSDIHRALICGAERFSHNSMFDSVHKIADVIRKCKMDSTKVKWTFMMMLDRVQEGYHWFKTQCMCISFLAQ